MERFVARFTQRHEIIQSILGMDVIFRRGEFRLRGDVVGVEVVPGTAQETLRQDKTLVIAGHLYFFFRVADVDRNPFTIRKCLLDKGWGQSYRLGNLDTV